MKTRLLLSLAGLLLALTFSGLGSWQWQRGALKDRQLEDWAAALQSPAVALDEALRETSDLPRRVSGQGRFIGPYLLLDNQQREGQPGLRYYRALETCCDQAVVLVELGWRPWLPGRVLPPAATVDEHAGLTGTLAPWPGQGLRLGQDAWQADGDNQILLMRLDHTELEQRLGLPLATRILRPDPALDFGFSRDDERLPNTLPPERHRGYAIQWFGLALTALIVTAFLNFRFRKP